MHGAKARADGRGALIVFEGGDRCGKTTQSKKLVAALQEKGVKAEWCSFPDRQTGVGRLIDSYLCGKDNSEDDVIHLLFAANRLEKRRELVSKLKEGTTIVMDRYAQSGAAFTLAKNAPGINLSWCKAVEAGKLPAPDVIFFLRAPVEVAAQRGGFGDERYEVLEFQKKVLDWYIKLSQMEGWAEVDATQSIEKIHEAVLEQALEVLMTCKKGRPLYWLWAEDKDRSLGESGKHQKASRKRSRSEAGGGADKENE